MARQKPKKMANFVFRSAVAACSSGSILRVDVVPEISAGFLFLSPVATGK